VISLVRLLRSILRITVALLIIFSILPYFLPMPANILTVTELSTPDSRFITVGDTVLHYHYFNQSTPAGTVVFLHGFGGSLFSFRDNIDPLLENGFAVVLVDLPGFGLSERTLRTDYSSEGRARLMLELCDQLELKKPIHWAGHSMGGNIASWLPSLRNDAAASLILIAAPYGAPPQRSWPRIAVHYPPIRRWMKAVLPRFITEERIGSLLRSAYGRPLQKHEILGYMQPLLIADTHHTMIGMTRDQSHVLPDREAISIPVLVIWGEQDTWVSPEDAPLWCNAISDCRQEIIPGAGHNPMETHTDTFNHILVDFVLTTEAVTSIP
jgi:pimeloyl-ACP methyl ester carboxylesterase